MSVLARSLDELLPDAMRSAKLPALCECGRLHPIHKLRPRGKRVRYVCGMCYETMRRANLAEFRPGHDPANILP